MFFLIIINFTLPGVLNSGDRLFYYDARSLSLGGNLTVLENTANPASSGLTNRVYLNLGGYLYSGSEKRGLRVYDSYNNNIGVATISSNRTTDLDFTPLGFVVPIKFLRFGLRYYRFYDFNYLYHYDYRDDFYQIIKTVDDRYSGALNLIAPLICINLKGINIGIEQGFIYGKTKQDLQILFPQGADSIWSIDRNWSGSNEKLGLIFVPSAHLRLAYYYSHKMDVTSKFDSLHYPAGHNFGIYYQPPHRIPTRFVAEIDYESWDEPLLVYKFGVEHTILFIYHLRYGFCVFPDYVEPAVWTTNLTLGFGLQAKNYYFDFGFALGKRDYANTDFGGLDIENKYLFDETQNHFLLSFGFKL
ncbi:MAG: hypothetical protein ACUVQT_00420 [bacterium]